MIEATHNSMGLPKGWVDTELGQIAEILSGIGFPKKHQGKTEGEFPFYKVSDISQAVLKGSVCLRSANNYVSKDVCRELKGKPLKAGTVVFAKIGEAIKLNRRAILAGEALVDNNVMGVCAFLTDISSFLYYFLLTVTLGDLSRATTVPSVRKGDVEKISFPLPPLPEQKRIVAKIEELFTKLDAGAEALRKVKAELKRYRQAVLKHAFDGKLTAEWREKNRNKLEPASKLLERIAAEREKAQTKTKGRKKKLPPLDISNLPDLPEGWSWVQFGNLFSLSPQNGVYKPASFYGSGTPIIRIDSFYEGKIGGKQFRILRLSEEEINRYKVRTGQILINRVNSIEYLGKCGLVERIDGDVVFESNIMKVAVCEDGIRPKYVSNYLSSSGGLKELRKNAKHAVNQASINQGDVAATCVPLCCLEEQDRVVEEIDRHFSIADEVEQTVEKGLKQAAQLRQSILKRAFEGRLGPQDPNDAPAEKLLERIKAERAKLANGKRAKRKKE